MARHARLQAPRIGALTATLCVAVVVSALAIAGWDLSGGRLLTMSTASMCPTVCVGSLVAVEPQSGPVHPGELVTFRPPGQGAAFTHRVVRVEDNGSFTTKGDAEASPDPWVVPPQDVVGRVAFTVSGLGWWLRALPMVAVGTALLLGTRRFYRLRNRRSFERLVGVTVVAVPLLLLHPLISGQLIEVVKDPHRRGWLRGLFVNTGLLPEHLQVIGGQTLPRLGSSRLHWITGPKSKASVLGVHQWAALPAWGWAIVATLVLAPVIGFVVYRATRTVEPDTAGPSAAEAIALAPFVAPAIASLPAQRLPDGRLIPADAVLFPAASERQPAAAPDEALEPEPGLEPVLVAATVTQPAARYSTKDRSLHVEPEPIPEHPETQSDSGRPRSGGHRPRQARGSSQGSRRRSRTPERWSVRWPE
jgi:signal peptidase I